MRGREGGREREGEEEGGREGEEEAGMKGWRGREKQKGEGENGRN